MDELELRLLEMKDTSELMVDLAYSSLLYNNRDIAQEVMEMEEYTDELSSSIQQEAIKRAMADGDSSRAFVTIKLIERRQVTTNCEASWLTRSHTPILATSRKPRLSGPA